ncbi:Exopolyphosphatase [Recurvomyces mirabilis]|uniref:Exopolyphosphatase n=1 Tax=Recurvomyces mirabilis TaxID=574656 RepID=A0AAE1C692_9PEZI|nr:Exopolyphosphatase [Recurvomyces mirabilis]KAK5161733.1 Exopolyphosphatase [Recurvomyces mirabilis]
MSRMPIRTFLVLAKRHLQQNIHNRTGSASFVLGNESADLDSITCALVYGYIQSSRPEARRKNSLVIPVVNIPAADLPLRPELTALLRHADVKSEDLVTLDDLKPLPLPLDHTNWTLVDHNAMTGALAEHYSKSITGVIDHHNDEKAIPFSADPRIIQKCGSCSSLVTNYLRTTWEDLSSSSSTVGAANAQSSDGLTDDFAYTTGWDARVAKLALGSILIDTFNLTDESKVTEDDKNAVRYLEAKINASMRFGKDYDREKFFEEINAAKVDLESLCVEDVLRKDYKQWKEGNLTLGISSVIKPVEWLQQKAGNEKFSQVLEDFAKDRGLDLFAVMTAYTAESGKFARQMILSATSDNEKATGVVNDFSMEAGAELQLGESEVRSQDDSNLGVKIWIQGNVAASRKQVGPMLREAMR